MSLRDDIKKWRLTFIFYSVCVIFLIEILQGCKKSEVIHSVTPIVTVFDSVKNMSGTRTWTGNLQQFVLLDSPGHSPYPVWDTSYLTGVLSINMFDVSRVSITPDPYALFVNQYNGAIDTLNFERFDTSNNVLIYSVQSSSNSSSGSSSITETLNYYFLSDSIHYELTNYTGGLFPIEIIIDVHAPKKH